MTRQSAKADPIFISSERQRKSDMRYVLMVTMVTTLLAGAARGQQKLFVYPQKGQSAEQQQKDQAECESWAKTQGADPSAPPAGGNKRARGAVGGAARGAAAGAAVGAIAGDAGKGAGAGAVVGAIGGRRKAKAGEQQAQATAQDTYARAFGACMEGRGYSVK
jgi:hypothetical protein